MRRTVLLRAVVGIAAGALTVSVLTPASGATVAAAQFIKVSGHNLSAAGLQTWGAECDLGPNGLDEAQPAFTDATYWEKTRLYRTGGTLGSHSIGWQNTALRMAGPVVRTDEPGDLQQLSATYQSPSGAETGRVVAFYDSNTGDPAGAAFMGVGDFAVSGTAWQGSSINLAEVKLTWRSIWPAGNGWYTDYTDPPFPNTHTVKGMDLNIDTQNPGGASGTDFALVGVMMGCSGNPWYIDNLNIATSTDSRNYDFEGVTTTSHIWATNPAGAMVRDNPKTSVRIGSGTWLGMDTFAPSDTNLPSDWVTSGKYALYAQPYGAPGFSPVNLEALANQYDLKPPPEFSRGQTAYVPVSPTTTTTYELRYLGTETYAPSVSSRVVVEVQSAVKAKVTDRSLVQGRQPLVVKGNVFPETKGIKVVLEKKAGKKWKKLTVKRTAKKGRFTFNVPTTSSGELQVRVRVISGKGTVGTFSTTKKVNVRPYVPPPPKQRDKPDYTPTQGSTPVNNNVVLEPDLPV